MYELPLMGHTLVAYCWGGKSQNIEGALRLTLKLSSLSEQDSLFAAFRICGPVLQTQI